MSENVFEDPDLTPAKNPTRSQAAQAREISSDPVFNLACANLTKHYMREFVSLDPKRLGIHFADACVRAQLMLNVVGDVVTQLKMIADHGKVDAAATQRTMRGGAAS